MVLDRCSIDKMQHISDRVFVYDENFFLNRLASQKDQ